MVYDGIAGDTLTQSWPMPRAMADVFERQDVDGAIQQLLQYEVHGLEQALDNLLTAPARRTLSSRSTSAMLSSGLPHERSVRSTRTVRS